MKPRWLVAPNPSLMTLDGTRTFIIGERRPVVIDPGPAIEAHVDAIVRELRGVTPAAIVVTHGHRDHADAADALSRATGAPIPVGGYNRIETDAGAIEFVPTPGHTPDHVVIRWVAAEAVFVGDLLMGEGNTTLVAAPEGDLRHYLASLDALDAMAARTLYPAHGPPITDASAAIERYRRHRMTRIEQVRSALAAGIPADPAMLARHVYGSILDPALNGAARGSIEAILAYLDG